MPTGFTKGRGHRLRDGEIAGRPIRGAGIKIEYENGHPARVWPVERSNVLHIEQRRVDEGTRRRLSLVEWWGDEEAPAHASRHVADLFSRDSDALEFAIAAMREKISRDQPQDIDLFRPTRFTIVGSRVESDGPNTVLVLTCQAKGCGRHFRLLIPLESGDHETQVRGQVEFQQLTDVLGLGEIEDVDALVGHNATVIMSDTGGLVFSPIRFQMGGAT